MIRFSRQVQWYCGHLDVAPFACVFFLLVIFVGLVSRWAPTPGVPIELPEASIHEDRPAVDWLVVVADQDGRLYMNQQAISEEELEQRLRTHVGASSSSLELLLQADARLNLGQMARFYGLCRRAGVLNMKFQTRPPRQYVPAPPTVP
jgi:biopolymer transport protein TolR